MGFDRKSDSRVSKEVWQPGDQFQGRFFLVRSMRGRAMIEVGKSKERPDVFDFCWCGPDGNSV